MPRTLKKIDRKKARLVMSRSLIALVSIAIGIIISAQFRSIPDRVTNPIVPYVGLKETKTDLIAEQAQLKEEIQSLQKSIEQAQNTSQDVTLTKDEISQLNYKKAQAGLTKLNGRGIIINLDDSKVGQANEDSIVHAADIRDIVNLLWGSGAEAISINGQRIVVNTAIDCIVNTILVNDVKLSTPFRIEAIGDQDLMYIKISDKNLLSNIHQRKSNNGLIFNYSKNNDITVPVFDGSYETKRGQGDV